jgi:hypothetical protein
MRMRVDEKNALWIAVFGFFTAGLWMLCVVLIGDRVGIIWWTDAAFRANYLALSAILICFGLCLFIVKVLQLRKE